MSTANAKHAGNRRKLTRAEKKEIAALIRAAKGDGKAHTAQQTIPYLAMYPDGICKVTEKKYSKSIAYDDINYQLAQADDKTAIFENWCDFLNYFDATVSVQLSFINRGTRSGGAKEVVAIPAQNDAFNSIRTEYADMLKHQLAKGNNGFVKSKYITFSVEADNLLMDTSQLMNHVVHRQLCYTFFTQVPIEPFFQLGLDFLFAGSQQLFQRGIGPQPAVVDGPPGQAQLFADLAVRHLEEPVHQQDIPSLLGHGVQRGGQTVVPDQDHIPVQREGGILPRIDVVAGKLLVGFFRKVAQGHKSVLPAPNGTVCIEGLAPQHLFAKAVKGMPFVLVVAFKVHVLTSSLPEGGRLSPFAPYWFSKCPFWPFFRKFLKNIFSRLILRSFHSVRVDVPSRTKGGGERQPTAKKCRERQKAPTQV